MSADFESCLSQYCREAGLSAQQTEIVELYLVLEMPPAQIRLKVRAKRVSEVQSELNIALRRVAAVAPEFWEPAQAFPRHLMSAISNRADHEERPDGLRGVTPDASTKRFQGAPMISADDRRLRQDITSAGRLWANAQRAHGVAAA